MNVSFFRDIQYTVPELLQPIRISTFLRQKGYSRQNLIELKKYPDRVSVDGSGRYLNERLLGGELLTVHIPLDGDVEGKFKPADLPVDILYEDADILVVNKAAGMPVHPSHNNRNNTLANALAFYFGQKNIPFLFRCSNRLDRDTSGLTVVAKHMVSGNILSVMGTHREIRREYLGIVRGAPSPRSGRIDAPLAREAGSVLKRRVDWEHGEAAITHYSTRLTSVFPEGRQASSHDAAQNTYSLISFTLETGRTHQIRVHMKHIGYPLIGDYLYNPDFDRMHRQALHCAALHFAHPMTGKLLHFSAPLPEDMQWLTARMSE